MLPLAGNRYMHVTNNEKTQQPMPHGISHLVRLQQDTRSRPGNFDGTVGDKASVNPFTGLENLQHL